METNNKNFMKNLAKAISEKITNCEVVLGEMYDEVGIICDNFVAYEDVRKKLDEFFKDYDGRLLRIRHNDVLCQSLIMLY